MPGLSDFLLDPRGQLRNASLPQNPPRPPRNIPPPGASLAGVNPRLVAAVQGGATYLPPGYRIEAVSGKEGRTDGRSHHSRGNAADFRIIGPNGPIPHKGEDTTGMYTHLARGVRTWALKNDPEIAGKIGYGGAFGTKIGGGGVPDLMHYDLGGSRGNMRPQVRFAMLQPLTTGEQQQSATAVANAAPQQPARSAMPAPSGQATRVRGAAISPAMAMQKLQSLGFNEAQSKAIVGNMVQESSLRPGAVTAKEGSHGLMQWRGDRFASLQQFAQGKGTDWRDANTQMEFIAHEMKNNPYERQQSRRFMAANTVEEANAGMKSYLRYGDNSDGKRLRYAQEIPSSTGGAMAQSVAGSPGQQAIEQAAPLAPGATPPVPGALAYGPTGAAAAPPAAAPGPAAFDPEGSGYDYDTARKAGLGPDATGHWPSRDPATGAILKGRQHPTWNLTEKGERDAGNAIYSRNGRYYSGTVDDRIDAQIEKMYGVPPEAKPPAAPGDIQGRIDEQIDKMYGATAPPPAPAAAPTEQIPLPRPRPAEMAQASSPVSPPAPRATQGPPARANAPAGPAPAVQGRSKLAQGIIAGYGPGQNHSLTTFVEPGTGKEIITGNAPTGENIYLNLGRTGAGQPAPQTRSAAAPAPTTLKTAIAAAVPLPRPRPGEAPPSTGTAGPLSTMTGTIGQAPEPKLTGADLDPRPLTQRGDLLSQTPPHPGAMSGLMAPDPLAAGIMQPPAAGVAKEASLGDSMASSITNPASSPAAAWPPPQQPSAWPAPGVSLPPYSPAPTYEAFGSQPQPGPQPFAGQNQSALPWWMQQNMPGFTPQNFGNWGGIGDGGWSGFG